MRWRSGKVSNVTLSGLALVALLCAAGVERCTVEKRARYYDQKMDASRLALVAQQAVRDGRLERGLPIDSVNDFNTTGLIGPQYTLITTDRAALRLKLTSTNPNFAAVIVELLERAKVRRGDTVGVALTGAYPGLNIAVVSACEALKVEPLIITSVGSSSWGATDPTYTWLDMESVLYERGVFHHRSVAASLGGGADLGKGLSPRGRELIRDAAERNGCEFIEAVSLEESIARRMDIYDSLSAGQPLKAYINVGGGVASMGSSQNARLIPPGVTVDLGLRPFPQKGVTLLMAARGVPIIHLLEVDRIAERFDLPIAPEPLPEIGEGKIFATSVYSVPVALGVLLFYSGVMFCLIRLDVKHYLFRPRHEEMT